MKRKIRYASLDVDIDKLYRWLVKDIQSYIDHPTTVGWCEEDRECPVFIHSVSDVRARVFKKRGVSLKDDLNTDSLVHYLEDKIIDRFKNHRFVIPKDMFTRVKSIDIFRDEYYGALHYGVRCTIIFGFPEGKEFADELC